MSERIKTRSQKHIYNTRYRKRQNELKKITGANKQMLIKTVRTTTIKRVKSPMKTLKQKNLQRVKSPMKTLRQKNLQRVKSLTTIKKSEYKGKIIRISNKDAELVQINTKTGIATYRYNANINPYFYFNIELDVNTDYLILNKGQYYFVRCQNGELIYVDDKDDVFLRCDVILLESNEYDVKTIKEKLNTQGLNVKFKNIYCDTGFNITHDTIIEYTNKLNELNRSIHTKCDNLSLFVDLDYLACNQIIILLKSGENEFARVLIKHIYDDDNILFNTMTNKACEGNGYNKLLGAATILLCPYFINVPIVKYITLHAVNITTIYVFMKYFKGFAPKNYDNFNNGDNEEFYNYFRKEFKPDRLEDDEVENDNMITDITYDKLKHFTKSLESPFSVVYLKVPIKNVENAELKFKEFLENFTDVNCKKDYSSAEKTPI